MNAGFVFAVIATVLMLAMAANATGRAAQTMEGLFSPPSLGWPHGVQEDDDLSWRWGTGRVPSPREPAEAVTEAVATHVLRPTLAVRIGRAGASVRP